MKNLTLFYALVLLTFMPAQAWAQKKEVYRASNMTVKMEVFLGAYDPDTQEHILSPAINFDSFGSWFEFSAKIDELPSAPLTAEIGDFSKENFIMIKEYDNEGLLTRETVFTPGLIQTNVFEVSFYENLRQANAFFLDVIEMQMSLASFGEHIDYTINPKEKGVVIQFPISNILPNPIWKVKSSVYITEIMSRIDFETNDYQELFYKGTAAIDRIETYTKKQQDIFHVHINVDDENIPYKLYVDDNGTLALKRTSFKRLILDKSNYYSFFLDFFQKALIQQEEEKAQKKAQAAAEEAAIQQAITGQEQQGQ